jgi:hypothetical protein
MSIEPEPLCGYIPGGYYKKCRDCGAIYEGHKNSYRCEACAKAIDALHKRDSEPHIVSEPEDNGSREALMKIVRDTTGLILVSQIEMLTDQILTRLFFARFVIKPFE